MFSVWQAGDSICERASGMVTEQPEPGAVSQFPKYWMFTLLVASVWKVMRAAVPEVDIWNVIGPRFDGKSDWSSG
jgi:hypothetical protein